MVELKPCPFCGGEAEIHERYNSLHKYAQKKSEIPKGAKVFRYSGIPGKPPHFEYSEKVYIPQCKESSCIGRAQKQFFRKNEAIEAWNRRVNDG